MKEKGDWEDFAVSGKVMDYLEYKGCIDRATNLSDVVTGPETAGNVLFVEENERRRNSHEGNGDTDRHGFSIFTGERV